MGAVCARVIASAGWIARARADAPMARRDGASDLAEARFDKDQLVYELRQGGLELRVEGMHAVLPAVALHRRVADVRAVIHSFDDCPAADGLHEGIGKSMNGLDIITAYHTS